MTDDEKWQASLACDPAFDGRFFYGVKTTGIFCGPSCHSKSSNHQNVIFFMTRRRRRSGLRPCKRCRPDLLAYQPQKEMAKKIQAVCAANFTDPAKMKSELKQLGLRENRLKQVFQAQYGQSLPDYCHDLQIQEVKRLLTQTQASVLQIALQSGFGSLSAFYAQFRRHSGLSPAAFRAAMNRQDETK